MDKTYEFDVFVSYAIEDKTGIVNELVQMLEERGLRVWYAANKLIPGKSVDQTIREGLFKSRHGIVILSPHYFRKEWPQKELHVLWAREDETERKILPVWYNITEAEIRSFNPLLADKFGIPARGEVHLIADELVRNIMIPESIKKNEKCLLC